MAAKDLSKYLDDFRVDIGHECGVCHTKYSISMPLSEKQKAELGDALCTGIEGNFAQVDKALEKLRNEFNSFLRSQYHPTYSEAVEKQQRYQERARILEDVDNDVDKRLGPNMSLSVDTSDPLLEKVEAKYKVEAKESLRKIIGRRDPRS